MNDPRNPFKAIIGSSLNREKRLQEVANDLTTWTWHSKFLRQDLTDILLAAGWDGLEIVEILETYYKLLE